MILTRRFSDIRALIASSALLIVAMLLLPVVAHAAPIYVSALGSDATGDGSPINPYATIQHGIDSASAGDDVRVGAGTFVGDIRLTKDGVSIYGAGADDTTLVGSGTRQVIDVADVSTGTVIADFTITGGSGYHGQGIECYMASPTITRNLITGNAGGISCDWASPTIAGNTIVGNTAPGRDWGIYCAISSATITSNTISGNGGGIHAESLNGTIAENTIDASGAECLGAQYGTIAIVGNTFSGGTTGMSFFRTAAGISGNTITGCTQGGGVYGSYSALDITGNTISKNTGGGIRVEHTSQAIRNNTITGNTSSGPGGGISCSASWDDITGNTIAGNTASDGGGIYVQPEYQPYDWRYDPTIVTIGGNTVVGNNASGDGAGIACAGTSSLVTIVNNEISKNHASGDGGGIECSSASSPSITNDTITQNTAAHGGGIACDGLGSTPSISNCILWDNGQELDECQASYSDVDDSGAPSGLDNISVPPSFVGTSTDDFRLSADSPCVDVATSTAAPATDRDGASRPSGSGWDMGAYEYHATCQLHYLPGSNGTVSGAPSQTVDYRGSGSAITASPTVGYRFAGWSDGRSDNPRVDTHVTADATYTATFALANYAITVSPVAHGTVAPSADRNVGYGADAMFTIAPDLGFHILDVLKDGSSIGASSAVTFRSVKEDGHTLSATFAVNTYRLRYEAPGPGGSIVGSDTQVVDYRTSGDSVTASPTPGYHFVSWSDGVSANPRTDTAVTSNVNVSAGFAVNTYLLRYAAGINGSLSGTASQTVAYGGSGTSITALPASGYHFASWSDGVTANPRTDTNVTADKSISAVFALATYTLPTTTKLAGTSSAKLKKTYKLSGTVRSSAAPGKVAITMTRYSGGKWRSMGHVHVNVSRGGFSYSFKPKYRGSWRFVASYTGGVVDVTTYKASNSGVKTVKVK
jgi:parallel beta-helix repeat protein